QNSVTVTLQTSPGSETISPESKQADSAAAPSNPGFADIARQIETLSEYLQQLQHGGTVTSGNPDAPDHSSLITTFDGQIRELQDALQQKFDATAERIESSQSAAADAQSDVLRTLTEVIFQTSASAGASSSDVRDLLVQFEDRIADRIQDMLRNLTAAPSTVPAVAATSASPVMSATTTQKPAPKPESTTPSRGRSWAEIRQAYLTGSELEDSECAAEEPQPESPPIPVTPVVSAAASEEIPAYGMDLSEAVELEATEFCLATDKATKGLPRAVNPAHMTQKELVEAVVLREETILALAGRLRRLHYSTTQTLSPEQLRGLATTCPEVLWQRVTETLDRLDEQLRVGELEMSLERARLARQVVQMEETRSRLEASARQLGIEMNADGSLGENTNPAARQSSSRRWLGKLGFNH
ncbi:MAG: hypothetical protein KDA85_20265, partial [Planctomycetaceae bacterium]|nr:hypothetical protein [Planctomycetaceae bacterium]